MCKSFGVFVDSSAVTAALRFFNSARSRRTALQHRTIRLVGGADTGGEDAEATSVGAAAGRFRTGRSESSSAPGAIPGAVVDAAGALAGAGRPVLPSASGAAGGVDAAGGGARIRRSPWARGGGASSGHFGFQGSHAATPAAARALSFDVTALFLAAASFAAAIALADCRSQLPAMCCCPAERP